MSLNFKMVLSLVDRASSGMNKIARNANRMADRVSRSVKGMSSRMGSAMARAFSPAALERGAARFEKGLTKARGRLMDAAAMASIAIAPVLKIARFEHQLAHSAMWPP